MLFPIIILTKTPICGIITEHRDNTEKMGDGMIYCISDVRGDYDKFMAMYCKINLKRADTLYLLGNIIDGKDGMKLLLDLMMRDNVYPIIGWHEYSALKCLSWLAEHPDPEELSDIDPETMRKMADWISIGGQETISQFRSLTEDEREMIIDYLSDFSLYEEVAVGGKDFVLVHAGINNFTPDKDLDDYDIYELISESPDFSKIYYNNKYLVSGHTPTRRIYEEENPLLEPTPVGKASRFDKVFMKNNHIAINCGVDIGGKLAAVRLDDLKEFYID